MSILFTFSKNQLLESLIFVPFLRLYFVHFFSDLYYFLLPSHCCLFCIFFKVPSHAKLHYLCGLFLVSWDRPVILLISLSGLRSLCPTDWGVLLSILFVSRYLISSLVLLLTHSLLTCYLPSMALCVFWFSSCDWFLFHSFMVR